MVLNFPKFNTSVKNFLRACGYAEFFNRHTQETSFTRNLDPGRFYPRFHIYAQESADQVRINLHLDAKQPSYEGTAAHGGEYESPVVEKEAQRIKMISERFISKDIAPKPIGFKEKRSLWKKIKGLLK